MNRKDYIVCQVCKGLVIKTKKQCGFCFENPRLYSDERNRLKKLKNDNNKLLLSLGIDPNKKPSWP